jgi:DNA methyltransferase 1-associated protein 1
MSNSADVRSILDLPSSSSATPISLHKKLALPSARKPDGISRELFSLIGPSSTTLVAQLAKPRLKQKPNLGAGSKIKWCAKQQANNATFDASVYREWRAFKNGARADSLQLKHWAKATADPDTGTFVLSTLLFLGYESKQSTSLPNTTSNDRRMYTRRMNTCVFWKVINY